MNSFLTVLFPDRYLLLHLWLILTECVALHSWSVCVCVCILREYLSNSWIYQPFCIIVYFNIFVDIVTYNSYEPIGNVFFKRKMSRAITMHQLSLPAFIQLCYITGHCGVRLHQILLIYVANYNKICCLCFSVFIGSSWRLSNKLSFVSTYQQWLGHHGQSKFMLV